MSIQIKLYVDDNAFNVLDYHFGFFQNADYTGRPITKSEARPFDFVVEASKDITFVEWAMHDAMMKKKVEIVFSSRFGKGKSTKITLLDVHCIFCKYHFTANTDQPFTVSFSLSPATIIRDGEVLLSRHWKVTDPARLNQPVTVREEEDKEPRITNQYITDRDDVELDSYERGQDIYYVIESEHMLDKAVDIELPHKEDDFLYKGKRLTEDTIKHYTITSNIEKIPLEVIPEDYND